MKRLVWIGLALMFVVGGCKSEANPPVSEPAELTEQEEVMTHVSPVDGIQYYEDFAADAEPRYLEELKKFVYTLPKDNFLPVKVWTSEETNLEQPNGIAVVGDELWVVDEGKHQVSVFDLQGQILKIIGGLGNGPGEFQTPRDIWYALFNDSVYVLDAGNGRVQRLDTEGHYLDETSIVLRDDDQKHAQEMAVDDKGRIYVSVEHARVEDISLYRFDGDECIKLLDQFCGGFAKGEKSQYAFDAMRVFHYRESEQQEPGRPKDFTLRTADSNLYRLEEDGVEAVGRFPNLFSPSAVILEGDHVLVYSESHLRFMEFLLHEDGTMELLQTTDQFDPSVEEGPFTMTMDKKGEEIYMACRANGAIYVVNME